MKTWEELVGLPKPHRVHRVRGGRSMRHSIRMGTNVLFSANARAAMDDGQADKKAIAFGCICVRR